MPFHNELLLCSYEWFQRLHKPRQYEVWSFEDQIWSEVPWPTSGIPVTDDDDILFVRAMSIQCLGFGRELEKYDQRHGLALRGPISITASIYSPPLNFRWVVAWGKVSLGSTLLVFRRCNRLHAYRTVHLRRLTCSTFACWTALQTSSSMYLGGA